MPTSRQRLVFYCDELTADEVRRLAALDGRTVSSWLSRLVSDAVAADAAGLFPHFTPPASAAATPDPAPTPPAADPVEDDHAPASRRERDDPEYAAWLKSHGG